MHILIAEDEAIVAHDIAAILEDYGHTIAGIVDTAEDVLAVAETARPDIVLLDIHLRGEHDGIAIGPILRERFQLPFVYLTAHADRHTVQRAVATVPFGYVIKPFDEQGLLSTLEVACNNHRLEQQLKASEQRFITTLRSIADGAIVADTAGRVTFVNTLGAQLIGLAPEAALGQLLGDVLVLVDTSTYAPHGAPTAPAAQTHLDTLASGPRRLLAHDGREWLVEHTVTPIRDDAGCSTGIVVVFREISARRLAEQALQQANCELQASVAALEQRTREVAALSALGGALLRCASAEECYAIIVETGRHLFADADGVLYIQRTAPHAVEAVAMWGAGAASYPSLQPGGCWALRHARVMLGKAEASSCACVSEPLDILHQTICVPLSGEDGVCGVLHMRLPQSADPLLASRTTAERGRLAVALAEQAALGLANIRMRLALREQAVRDALTGLFNRRYLEESLAREQRRAARSNHPIGLIFLDIDHFKQINDAWGHAASDTVLHALGRLLLAAVRTEDIVCRYGGEEFVLALPSAPEAATFTRAEAIRQQVQDLRVFHDEQLLPPISISAGITVITDHSSDVTDALRRADDALHQAKRAGRNCTRVATPPPATAQTGEEA